MRKTSLIFVMILSLASQNSITAQSFRLLKDINVGSNNLCLGYGRQPIELTERNGELFFYAAGWLYKTDGTTNGTIPLKETSFVWNMINVNGKIFFSADSLWISDGTEQGTHPVQGAPGGTDLTNLKGVLYYLSGDAIWRTDGTTAGTFLIKSLNSPKNLINVNGTLFFSASDPQSFKMSLWKSDGSEAGTVMIKELGIKYTSYNEPTHFFAANGLLYFIGVDELNGEELWKSDGTANGTGLLKDIEPGNSNSSVRNLASANNAVYFFAKTTKSGNGLWKTDGTSTGTVQIKDLSDVQEPRNLLSLNNTLFFSGYDDVNGQELWKSDGTEVGTAMMKNIYLNGSSSPENLTNINGTLYFSAASDLAMPQSWGTPCFGYQGALWKSDGTEMGTVLVKNTIIASDSERPQKFVNVNGNVYFIATDGGYGMELWKSDGTSVGTYMVKDIFRTPGSNPARFTLMNGRVFFIATDGDAGPAFMVGRDVHQTDGTPLSTRQSTWINTWGSQVKEICPFKNELYIVGSNFYHGSEIWKTDGKGLNMGEKTDVLKDIAPGIASSEPKNLFATDEYLFFSADDTIHGQELWRSNGTAEGTQLVKDINPNGGSNPANFIEVNGQTFFTATDGYYGIELWKTDGTEQGTNLVKDINLYHQGSDPTSLININAVVYFSANDGLHGYELWKSDGTEQGTVMVKDIYLGSASSNPQYLTNVNGTLFFSAKNAANGIEIWKSDGTPGGTTLVKDIRAGNVSGNPTSIVSLNGVAYFAADNGISGPELWKTDGTSAGTIVAADVWPGESGSNPTVLTRIGNNIHFAADDGIHGNEAWLYNTITGARLMSDIEPGPGSSDPTEFFEYGSKILAAATYSMVGSEVWIADIPADIPTLIATITADGPITVCTGKAVTLKANTGAGYTYQWKKAGVNLAGATQPNYTATTAGYYSVVVSDGFGATATSETVIVTVVNPPLATVAAAGPLSFCAGKNVLLKATTGTGFTYQWKKAGVNIDNATSSNYTATTAGAYSVVVKNATGCSAASALINVTVNAVPLANVAAASALTFCEGKTVQLKAILGAGYTYQWKWGGANIAGATSSNYTASATGYYTVIVTNAAGCSATSAALAVTVKPMPLATITATGPTTICSGKNVLLKANTGTNYTYQWKLGATVIPGAVQSTHPATLQGFYSVIVTNSSGCSVTSAAIAVTVKPLPVATITPAGPLTFCVGQSVILKANTGTNYTYLWRKGGVNIPGATQVNYTASSAGVYSVIVTNASGCPVTSAGVTVAVNIVPLATVAVASATTFCAGKSVLLKATLGTANTYQWKKNNINLPLATSSNYTATETGVYSVVVTNVAGCSTLSIATNVTVVPLPAAIITTNGPLTFSQGGNVILSASAGAGNTYQWKKDGVNITGATTASYTVTASGSYSVTVTNAGGCQANSQPAVVTVTQTRPITKGLQEVENITVYPNPLYRNNYLNIDWSIAGHNAVFVTVYDMTGKKINSQRLLAGERTIKITGASGVYLVECRWGVNKRKIFKVVKVE